MDKLKRVIALFKTHNIDLTNHGYCLKYSLNGTTYSLYLEEDKGEDLFRINHINININILKELIINKRIHKYFIGE